MAIAGDLRFPNIDYKIRLFFMLIRIGFAKLSILYDQGKSVFKIKLPEVGIEPTRDLSPTGF
jgi:hypothetical protein